MEWLERVNPQPHAFWHGTWAHGTLEPLRVLVDHELVLVADGACEVTIGERVHHCPEGSWVIVPPGLPHLTRVTGPRTTRTCVHFDWTPLERPARLPLWSFAPARPERRDLRPAPAFVPGGVLHGRLPDARRAADLAQALRLRWTSADEAGRRSCRAPLLDLLLAVLAPAAPRRHRDRAGELAGAVKDLLDDVDLDLTSIRTALTGLGYSYEHLCRLFTRTFGIAPLRYVTHSRLERAKLLLRDPQRTIAAIARELGYRDPGYFARAFRRYAGISPRAYALSVAGGGPAALRRALPATAPRR